MKANKLAWRPSRSAHEVAPVHWATYLLFGRSGPGPSSRACARTWTERRSHCRSWTSSAARGIIRLAEESTGFSPTQRRRPLPSGPVARDRFSALLHAISVVRDGTKGSARHNGRSSRRTLEQVPHCSRDRESAQPRSIPKYPQKAAAQPEDGVAFSRFRPRKYPQVP